MTRNSPSKTVRIVRPLEDTPDRAAPCERVFDGGAAQAAAAGSPEHLLSRNRAHEIWQAVLAAAPGNGLGPSDLVVQLLDARFILDRAQGLVREG